MRAVIAGAIDIATTARPLKAEEAAAGAKAFALGRSPYVFVTSRPEPPTRLSSDDIVEIYALRRRTWADGTPLRLILRPRNDGETDFLIERFSRLRPVLEATHARQIAPVAQTDQLNLDLAETLQGSFASATLAAVVSEERRLKPLAIDNAMPSLSTLASGEYPHFRPLNLVASATTSEAGQAFVAFAGSAKGRAILAECAVLTSA
jgi:phosphate transport system substrate-binding protein